MNKPPWNSRMISDTFSKNDRQSESTPLSIQSKLGKLWKRSYMRALIVDDELSMCRLMRRCLSKWGWSIDESHSVLTAFEIFRQGHYDLALCDVDLPDGDGVSLARAMSKAKPSLRVIMVSGNPENLDRARAAGFERCLGKPFDLNELKILIDESGQGENRYPPC